MWLSERNIYMPILKGLKQANECTKTFPPHGDLDIKVPIGASNMASS